MDPQRNSLVVAGAIPTGFWATGRECMGELAICATNQILWWLQEGASPLRVRAQLIRRGYTKERATRLALGYERTVYKNCVVPLTLLGRGQSPRIAPIHAGTPPVQAFGVVWRAYFPG